MLDLKVFTYRETYTKTSISNQTKETLMRFKDIFGKYTFVSHISDINKLIELAEIIERDNKAIETEKALRETQKTVDEIFEFGSDICNTEAEDRIFKKIKKTFSQNEDYNFEEAFRFIQYIRRNKELEEQITIFRALPEVKRLKNEMKKHFFKPKIQYYHFCSIDLYSNISKNILYKYFLPSDYVDANYFMLSDVENIIVKIFKNFKMSERLKRIFSDLFFYGVIPLDEIIIKPINLKYDKETHHISAIEISQNIPISKITKRTNKNKNTITIYLKNEDVKDIKLISTKDLDVFDLKEQKGLSHSEIVKKINKKYTKNINITRSRKHLQDARKAIKSIFYSNK